MSFKDVAKFNRRFELPDGTKDVLSGDWNTANYRLEFLKEELEELGAAIATGDRVKAFDALLDLEYVVQGTALFMGIKEYQWVAGGDAVHAANMSKIRVPRENPELSKRGSVYDVIKPEGWESPEETLKKILGE